MAHHVSLTRDGHVATVTLNRPDRRHSLSDEMLGELAAAFRELRDDACTRVVILTGAPSVFSAGAHVPFKRGMSPEERRQVFAQRKSRFRRLFERANTLLENLEQVTIAMVNGHAIGGGWGLVLACDFRFAAAEAEFWIPEVDLGVPLGVASTARFVRLVGPALAKEIILEGRRYAAAEAVSPCILWIDEVEKGFAGGRSHTGGGTAARVFGQFLNWLQEKRSPVFVVATANDLSGIPPEFPRAGRFDEKFFVGLPDRPQRETILRIHVARRGRDPARFDVASLATESEGFSGAELEQAVIGGLFRAYEAGWELETGDIAAEIRETYPLSRSRAREIAGLTACARQNARIANG
jgi:enoyl-CoA hydratase/carnithine racemase